MLFHLPLVDIKLHKLNVTKLFVTILWNMPVPCTDIIFVFLKFDKLWRCDGKRQLCATFFGDIF